MVDGTGVDQGRVQWRAFMKTVMNLRVTDETQDFLAINFFFVILLDPF